MRLLSTAVVAAAAHLTRAVLLSHTTPRMHTIADHALRCDGTETHIGIAWFDQTLNHTNPAQGTFKQKYFYSSVHWGGPGYPVILFTPGETALKPFCGYLTDRSLISQYAAAIHGAIVIIEHRYWGESSPYTVLTTETLKHLTLRNAVADLVNFARNAALPFANAGTSTNATLPFANASSSNAPHVPWILSGGSYSGALAAWTAKLAPGTFWAYHATSAPVQLVYDFWQFFGPIRAGMAANCSRDLAAITDYVDDFVETRPAAEVQDFKAAWGLASIPNAADFSSALVNAVDAWQDDSLTSGYTPFFAMCDAIEMADDRANILARNGTGNGTDIAARVAHVAEWFRTKFIPGWCYKRFSYAEYADPASVACLDSYNTSSILYTDRAVNNSADTQWMWLLCNEPFGYWQTGSGPRDQPSIASRLMTAAYFQRQCGILFGNGSDSATNTTDATTSAGKVDELNAQTDGWNFVGKRILWVNGEFDPWRPASVSSMDRPGGPLASTPDAPVVVIRGGKHCEDQIIQAHPYLMGVQVQLVNYMVQWINEFYALKKKNETAGDGVVPTFKPIAHLYGPRL